MTKGGFVLAGSAPKYPADSHQAYHLHYKKTKGIESIQDALNESKAREDRASGLRFLDRARAILLGHLRRERLLLPAGGLGVDEILGVFILRTSFLLLLLLALLRPIRSSLSLHTEREEERTEISSRKPSRLGVSVDRKSVV